MSNSWGQCVAVVVIGGALALTTSGCVKRYMNASKAAEARNSLNEIGRDAASAYETERMPTTLLAPGASGLVENQLCASASKTVPANASDIAAKKYMSMPTEWTSDPPDTGFTCLRFIMDAPQYYMYGYSRTGKGSAEGDSFTATARGDLDGDGVLSRFELTGKVQSHAVVVAPNVTETNPTE